MLFSAKAEYACVAMLELAARYGDPRPVRLADIADTHGIPQPFLVQILLQLKGAGLVASTRGAAGGYHLARRPEEISLADIITVIDRQDQAPRHERTRSSRRSTSRAVRSVLGPDPPGRSRTSSKRTTLADLDRGQSQALQYVI